MLASPVHTLFQGAKLAKSSAVLARRRASFCSARERVALLSGGVVQHVRIGHPEVGAMSGALVPAEGVAKSGLESVCVETVCDSIGADWSAVGGCSWSWIWPTTACSGATAWATICWAMSCASILHSNSLITFPLVWVQISCFWMAVSTVGAHGPPSIDKMRMLRRFIMHLQGIIETENWFPRDLFIFGQGIKSLPQVEYGRLTFNIPCTADTIRNARGQLAPFHGWINHQGVNLNGKNMLSRNQARAKMVCSHLTSVISFMKLKYAVICIIRNVLSNQVSGWLYSS